MTTAHVVLQEPYKYTKTCGLCGGNYGRNSYRSSMLGQDEALSLVVGSRLDYYKTCEPSYLQVVRDAATLPSANPAYSCLTSKISPLQFQTYQCSSRLRSEASTMCKQIFNCVGFRSCKQVVDMDWYMSTCIQDSCSREYLSAYPAPCKFPVTVNS